MNRSFRRVVDRCGLTRTRRSWASFGGWETRKGAGSGHRLRVGNPRVLCRGNRLNGWLRPAVGKAGHSQGRVRKLDGANMTLDYIVGLIVTVGLLVYLGYA